MPVSIQQMSLFLTMLFIWHKRCEINFPLKVSCIAIKHRIATLINWRATILVTTTHPVLSFNMITRSGQR